MPRAPRPGAVPRPNRRRGGERAVRRVEVGLTPTDDAVLLEHLGRRATAADVRDLALASCRPRWAAQRDNIWRRADGFAVLWRQWDRDALVMGPGLTDLVELTGLPDPGPGDDIHPGPIEAMRRVDERWPLGTAGRAAPTSPR